MAAMRLQVSQASTRKGPAPIGAQVLVAVSVDPTLTASRTTPVPGPLCRSRRARYRPGFLGVLPDLMQAPTEGSGRQAIEDE